MKIKSDLIRDFVKSITALAPTAPNATSPYKPAELWNMVLPVLKSMQLHNLASSKKSLTQVHLDQSRGENERLYEIYLDRASIITPKVIERIKLHQKDFHSMQWNSQAIQVFVWGNYINPETEQKKNVVVTPGMPRPVMP
jgi:hypothetical protein